MMPFVSHRIPFGLNLWIAARLMPVFARRPLDEILARATPGPGAQAYGGLSPLTIVAEVKRAVARPMRMRGRRCLREGLLAFHYLSLAGYRPILHFGLVPQTITTQRPQAHCWVTVNEVTVINPPAGPMIDLFAYDGSVALASKDATLARATYD